MGETSRSSHEAQHDPDWIFISFSCETDPDTNDYKQPKLLDELYRDLKKNTKADVKYSPECQLEIQESKGLQAWERKAIVNCHCILLICTVAYKQKVEGPKLSGQKTNAEIEFDMISADSKHSAKTIPILLATLARNWIAFRTHFLGKAFGCVTLPATRNSLKNSWRRLPP
eukprot:m.126697 g.126697  ORF g.126697 m.126697 type:complete len:171 (+) comp37915_c0_seq14:705-1217(+)